MYNMWFVTMRESMSLVILFSLRTLGFGSMIRDCRSEFFFGFRGVSEDDADAKYL